MGDVFSMQPRSQGNLAPMIGATLLGGAQAMQQPMYGGFMDGFSQSFQPRPMDQMRMAQLKTLGGKIAPIGGGLY